MSLKGIRALMKNQKALSEVMALGKQFDNETDPEKKEALKREIEARCAVLKGNLQGAFPQSSAEATAADGEADSEA